jgi:hypothetical protein
LGRSGVIGRKLFPDREFIAKALVLQLKLRAAELNLLQLLTEKPDKAVCAARIEHFFDAYLALDVAHGWHKTMDRWGLGTLQDEPNSKPLMVQLHKIIGNDEAVWAFIAEIGKRLLPKYNQEVVQRDCINVMGYVITRSAK